MLSFKINLRYSKKYAKNKCVCFNKIIVYNENESEIKNRRHRYDINRTRSRHGYEYTKYKMCLSMMMDI